MSITVPVTAKQEKSTIVEFRLEKIANGTSLVVTESGFDKLRPTAASKPSAGTTADGRSK